VIKEIKYLREEPSIDDILKASSIIDEIDHKATMYSLTDAQESYRYAAQKSFNDYYTEAGQWYLLYLFKKEKHLNPESLKLGAFRSIVEKIITKDGCGIAEDLELPEDPQDAYMLCYREYDMRKNLLVSEPMWVIEKESEPAYKSQLDSAVDRKMDLRASWEKEAEIKMYGDDYV